VGEQRAIDTLQPVERELRFTLPYWSMVGELVVIDSERAGSSECAAYHPERYIREVSILSLMTQRPDGVIETLAERDHMVEDNPVNYFHNGVAALGNIRIALAAAGVDEVRSVLDFACGYGRVLRMLKAAFPDAEIVACDLDRDAVDFCREVFDVEGVYATADPDELRIGADFDLIWCGSLLTHMPAERWPVFLEFFASHLAAGGVLVFTTHGRRIAGWLRAMVAGQDGPHERKPAYNLLGHEIRQLLSDLDRGGFGYQGYPQRGEYGFSLSRPDWVVRQILERPSLRLLALTESGWAGQQDIVACVKRDD
jgi:SAM-dependent methyltransferase